MKRHFYSNIDWERDKNGGIIVLHPIAGLWKNVDAYPEDTCEIRFYRVKGDGPDIGIGIEFRPCAATSFYTYASEIDAKAMGEVLAVLLGCSWYDPEEDADNDSI